MARFAPAILLATAWLLAPSASLATPITYLFQSGTASIDVEVDGGLVQSVSTPLSGTFFTFDAMAPAVTDLEYLIEDSIYIDSLIGTIDLSVVVEDGAGFSAPATPTGPGSWSYAGGPIDITAMVTVSGGSLGFWGNGGNPVTATVGSVDGTVDVAGSVATVVTPKQLEFGFIPFVGHDVVVTARVDFVGVAVPEPALAGLVLLGAAGLLASRRRAAAA